MNPKQQAINNKQRERRQRGHDFQEEILQSLRFIPNVWTINIQDGRGGSRPADRLIITEHVNILAELKRTAGRDFHLSFLRPNQIQGLVDFDQIIPRNYGIVFVSFHNLTKQLDEAYAFRLTTALEYMRKSGRLRITLEDFRNNMIPNIPLPRINEIYDMQGVIECRSL